MSLVWLVPAIITAIAIIPVAIATRRVASEVSELALALRRLGSLQPALAEVRSGSAALRAGLTDRPRR